MKKCTNCYLTKEDNNFYANKKTEDRLGSWCKECHYSSSKFLRKQNPIRTHAYDRKYHLRDNYNLTENEYAEMIHKSKGVCEICLKPPTTLRKTLFIDHSHQTGKVRGLLCHKCNTILGLANDEERVLYSAIEYLRKNLPVLT